MIYVTPKYESLNIIDILRERLRVYDLLISLAVYLVNVNVVKDRVSKSVKSFDQILGLLAIMAKE